ncbi:hypothetical protein H70357_06280 [Paenibacillus sp. FSL H7-0357]|uniref:hypothetical protein n=1 Tax=Paenibacillus sp. FSL H7-0357 TaxID=1536774 RepID=UPI0004F64F49|nr:hypothetical protein [Paenibacillus sp. FSL H7-0357]AIQ16330.1 hypothetical protein H70357_06280 [Paenibacillus sp. FSL H7-0357]
MSKVILHSLQYRQESHSFTDALYGILTEKGWFTLPKCMLSGMTAACFRFSVHRQLHSDSATAYNWMAEHLVACDLIGVTASQMGGFNFTPTFPLYQQQAISDIKACIDRGTGAVVWKERFVIVNGYHEQEQLFYYLDGIADSCQELPFLALGRNLSPYAYYQVYEKQIEIDVLQAIKESFIQAVFKAETHDIMLPESGYACGLAAYDAIVEALRSGGYDAEGAAETFFVYTAAKQDAAKYAQEVLAYWPAAKEIAAHYTRLSEIFEAITQVELHTQPLPPSRLEELITLFGVAKAAETAAIQSIRHLLREPIANRFHDIGLR